MIAAFKYVTFHLQGKHGRHRLVITDGEGHVTLIRVLRHFGRAAQPGGQTPLKCCIVGRNGGAGAAEAPEDTIGPCGLSLFSAGPHAETLKTVVRFSAQMSGN